jgi:hypothetical protein
MAEPNSTALDLDSTKPGKDARIPFSSKAFTPCPVERIPMEFVLLAHARQASESRR